MLPFPVCPMEIASEGGPVRLAGPKKENKWRQSGKNGFSQVVLLQVVCMEIMEMR